MDELRGPNIQIVLHVKEGLGFGFLRNSFIVSGSLNGYMLETDPVVPSHAPVFDAELVWEADKRRFRSLRVQNVPVKVEVYSMGTQGRKDKVGYLLLSLLGAQPCPSNKLIEIKHTWHKLLGVKSEGKCCHPQLLMSLSIEDRVNTATPRNELRMFHSNEIAFPSLKLAANPPMKSVMLTLNEYISESKKTVSSPDLQPKLLCDEGLIQIGTGTQLFVLSFVIGTVENLDLLLPDKEAGREPVDCYITYSVFTHDIMTDRVSASSSGSGTGTSASFNQRTSLRLAADLHVLGRYFTECPHLFARICSDDKDIGICSMDLRKLVPTDTLKHFVDNFCNTDNALCIHERCYIVRCEDGGAARVGGRRPFLDVEMSLKYVGVKEMQKPVQKPHMLTARSATHLESDRRREKFPDEILECRSGSCSNVQQDGGGLAYTSMAMGNTTRYKNASGESVLQTNELALLIKRMCDSFTSSQEKLLASRIKPSTSDMQIQCEVEIKEENGYGVAEKRDAEPVNLETSKSEPCINHHEKDKVNTFISSCDRETIMQRFVDELEDWKERQQELFKSQLKRKEEYHLELLAKEWERKRLEMEVKLSRGIEQCRHLAADLARSTEDFRLRGYRNTEREKKLLEVKKALESHYTAKYQELREASKKMEDDMNHQLKLKDMRIEELELKVMQLEKKVDVLKHNLQNSEKEVEGRHSGLTREQTASLIQELRCLEEKLDSAAQSKAFFKEQWGRAVRELHLAKTSTREHMMSRLQQDRRQLRDGGLDTIADEDDADKNPVNLKKLKDDFYVDILANTPPLGMSGSDVMDMYDDIKKTPKNPMSEKINELILQRDQLFKQDDPDEELMNQLNYEIRTLLLNCGT